MTVDNKNILFVENDPDFREPIEKLLKLEKFNVISASNIKDGVKLLDNNYDLAIFDTKFIEGDGIELLKIYKE